MQPSSVSKRQSPFLYAAIIIGILVLAAVPRLIKLDYFLMVDENLWYERSAHFLRGLANGDLAQTVQTGHPGVTTMWSGTLGLLLYYVQAALPDETLAQFSERMTVTPADLDTLGLLRLPLALLSALTVAIAFVLGRRLLGWGPALAGALLMAFEPLFLAHSRVLHHDSPAADFSLLAVMGWLLYLKERRRGYLLPAGVGVALATLSKVSSVFLLGFAGLTLLPEIWRGRRHFRSSLRQGLTRWLLLAGVTLLVIVLAWPAVWAAPGLVGNTILMFITDESGPHANGTFFMGKPVLDPGPLYYPVSLAFQLTPLTLVGLFLGFIGLGLAWQHARRSHSTEELSNYQWVSWLLLYAVLFVAYMSVLGKKQERYVLPAVVGFDLLAGWGYWQIATITNELSGRLIRLKPSASLRFALLPLVLLFGQFAFAWSAAPYYSTFYNPLLGGAVEAQNMLLIGRGEGLEQAVRYILARSGDQIPQVASWYGTTVTILGEGRMKVKDVVHPHFILGSDYVVFYINQLQRERKEAILSYVQRRHPIFTVQIAGIDYAYVFQGQAINHPVDSFAHQNRLVGKASLAGFDLPQPLEAGAQVPVRLYWVNDRMLPNENFYVRLVDELELDWGWGSCESDPSFGIPIAWQNGDIIESQCKLVVYPGTPPGEYLLRVGIINEVETVIGQMSLSPAEGMVVVGHPHAFPEDKWVPLERRVQRALNDDVALIGYDYTATMRKPGETIPITLYWRALQVMEDYLIRLSLRGKGPGQFAQWEGLPVSGRYGTGEWSPGELVRDPWQLMLPASLPGGKYVLSLALVGPDGCNAGRFDLGSLHIQGRDHAFTLEQPPATRQVSRLGEAIRLLGFDLAGGVTGERLMPGQELRVILTWQAEKSPARDYTVFVQLLDTANQVHAQHDGQPGDGILITSTWASGEYVRDEHWFELPEALPAGEYRLIVGMYIPDSGERLPILDLDGRSLGDHVTLNRLFRVP